MSHIVTIKTELRDATAIQAACRRLGLSLPTQEKVHLFSAEVAGLVVKLPGWHYPVVCDTASGQVNYDNYNGHWGDEKELNRFLQAYAVEKAKIEARKKGHSISEQTLADGSVKLSIQVGGGAA